MISSFKLPKNFKIKKDIEYQITIEDFETDIKIIIAEK